MKMRRLMTEVMTWSLLLTVLTAINPLTTLECHRREYSYKAVRTDHMGRQCWDYVKTMSCWGRCDSGEIADWRFPFKKSFHQVCMHEKRRLVTTRLRYCDPGVDQSLRQYTAADAITCSCRLCRSSDASCEGAGSSLVPTSTSSSPVSHYNSALPYRRRTATSP